MNERTQDDNVADMKKIETLEQKIDEIEDALDEFAKQVRIRVSDFLENINISYIGCKISLLILLTSLLTH